MKSGVKTISGSIRFSISFDEPDGGGGGSAIADAVAASTGQSFYLQTDTSAQFGDVADGATIVSAAAGDVAMTVFTGSWTWNETTGMMNLTGGLSVATSTPFDVGGQDLYLVIDTADSLFMTVSDDASGGFYAGLVENAGGSIDAGMTGPPTYYVNGVAIARTRQALFNAITGQGKKVLRIAGFYPSTAFDNGWNFGRWTSNNTYNLNGAVGDLVLCDAQDLAAGQAIEAELAARHGITL